MPLDTATNPSIDDYRNRLRARLDAQRQPQAEEMGPPAPPQQMPPATGEQMGQPAQQMGPPDPQKQMGPPAPAMGQAVQPMGQESTLAPGKTGKPAPELKFDSSKLQDAKTPQDLIDAAEPRSLGQYLNWYDREVTNINQAYANISQKLGERPDENRNLSRREKFSALMQFGLNLIKSSQGREDNTLGAFSEATANTLGGLKAQRKIEGLEYDQKAAILNGQRQGELKTLGTRGEAIKGQAEVDFRKAQQTAEEAKLEKEQNAAPDTLSTDQGVHQWDARQKKFVPSLGVDGKPLTNLKVGARGGSAASRDSRTANQKNIDDLVARKVPQELALDIVYKRVRDPRKMWQDVYRDRRRQFSSEKEARDEADSIMNRFYGAGWDDRAKDTAIPEANDPFGIRPKVK